MKIYMISDGVMTNDVMLDEAFVDKKKAYDRCVELAKAQAAYMERMGFRYYEACGEARVDEKPEKQEAWAIYKKNSRCFKVREINVNE